jgi:hypothetical protein
VPARQVEQLHLFYAWISTGSFAYRETPSGIEVLDMLEREPQADFPYEQYPAFFPQYGVTPQSLTADQQLIIKKLNRREGDPISLAAEFPALEVPRAQVGGEPRLLQWPLAQPSCPVCTRATKLLATFGNANQTRRGFTDNAYVELLFHLCEACTVIVTENMTD